MYDAVTDENEISVQQRSEIIVNPKALRAMMFLEASFNFKIQKWLQKQKVGELLPMLESSSMELSVSWNWLN